MNKAMPLIILMIMLLMLIVSWNNVFSFKGGLKAEYNEHITAAEAYMEKEIYIDAVKEYEAALDLQPDNYEVALKIMNLYKELGDKKAYIEACQNAINADKRQVKPYIEIADYYIESSNYSKAYKFLKQANDNIKENEDIRQRLIKIRSQYNLLTVEYDTFSGWYYGSDAEYGYAKVSIDGKYGLLKSDNKATIKCEYDDVGLLMNGVLPVKRNDEYFYVTAEGYRKLVTDDSASYLGTFSSTYAPAEINGKYGYIDKKVKEHHFEYDYAGCFSNEIAAVQKDGKWAVINTSFKNVTDYIFDEILLDEYGFCSTYGVFFAKQDGKYYLYNKEGEKISDGFEDAKLFASNEPAAVKLNGKWGFISKSGEIVIEPTYEDADSFSLGYAPFLENGKWGCIDEDGVVLIEPIFDEMKPFAKNGYALVKVDGIQKFAVVNIYE